MDRWCADNSVKIEKIFPLAIPNQTSTISMHILSLVIILKLSSGNENMDVWQVDNFVKY